MNFRTEFGTPNPTTPPTLPYPVLPLAMQSDSQTLPQHGSPPLPLDSPPPPYQNFFPFNDPQVPPYGPPPPYSPPNCNYFPPQTPSQAPVQYQQQPQPHCPPNQPHQWENTPVSYPGYPSKDYAPSCPPALEHTPHSPVLENTPYPTALEGIPHPPASETTPYPTALEGIPHSPASENTPYPTSLESIPHPPVSENTPYPSVFENMLPVAPPRRRQTKNVNRVPTIGFEEVDSNHPPINCYPSLPDGYRVNQVNPKTNFAQVSTPLPPNAVLMWEGSKPVRIFFVQRDGHVVTPDRPLKFCAYKCPPVDVSYSSSSVSSAAGHARGAAVLMKAEETWRLGLSKERSYVVKGLQGELAFHDDSTTPARLVVVLLPSEISSSEKQRLNVLLNSCSSVIGEPSNIVDKVETGVGTAFESFTGSVNSRIKNGTPRLHKTTKWLRKGTGQVVRFGGSLVSKGIHLVSDNVLDKDSEKLLSKEHSEIIEGLKLYRSIVNKNEVTKVYVFK